MDLKLLTISFITILTITSCKPYRYVDIQVLKPAETDTLLKVNKLYIVNSEGLKIDSSNKVDPFYYIQFLYNFKKELKKKLIETPLFSNTEIINTSNQVLRYSFGNLDEDQRNKTMVCTIQSVILNDSVQNILGNETWYMKYRIIYLLNLSFKRLTSPDAAINSIFIDTAYWYSPEISYELWDPTLFKSTNKEYAPKKDMAYIDIGKYAAQKYVNKITP